MEGNIKEFIGNFLDQLSLINDIGMVISKNKKSAICGISIIGQIEGHELLSDDQKTTKYEHLIPLLLSIEHSDEINGVLLLLNTVGGEIEAGLAMAEMIAGMTKPVVSLVLGGAHSIGIPLAVAAKHSFMVNSASMIVHPVKSDKGLVGTPQGFRYIEDIKNKIVDFIVLHSKITQEKLNELMFKTESMANEVGTILSAKDAVRFGIINEIGNLGMALTKLQELMNHNS